ncbi:MAG: polysaccharide deacetylase family protein, partial [Clostridiales bacterium]|nr:polysaccharide deacetylase family protein [Clostridiales bacterium]
MQKRKMRFAAGAAGAAAAVLALVLTLWSNTDLITVSNTVNGRNLPIYCVDTEEKKVSISFDAAWGNEDTQQILDILAEHNVRTTFFMTGGWVDSYPDDVKAIYEAGH